MADAAQEEVRDGEIEKTPENVDRRGGEAFAGWLGEGGLKGVSHDTADEMRSGVGEKHAAEEVRHEMG